MSEREEPALSISEYFRPEPALVSPAG